MAQRAKPAQHGRHDAPHQGAVAVLQIGEPRMGALAVELLVERPRTPQHPIEDVGGDAPGGKSRRVDQRCFDRGRFVMLRQLPYTRAAPPAAIPSVAGVGALPERGRAGVSVRTAGEKWLPKWAYRRVIRRNPGRSRCAAGFGRAMMLGLQSRRRTLGPRPVDQQFGPRPVSSEGRHVDP